MNGRDRAALAVTHIAAIGAGYYLAPKQPVDTEAKSDGLFQITTTKVLATTVESLREEARLLAYSYKGTAKVQTERTKWWMLGGRQELLVPAVVNYYVDLADLTLADVTYNEKAKLVTVRLPTLTKATSRSNPRTPRPSTAAR